MTDDLPESLARRPNIPCERQTLAQLRAERDYWDTQVKTAPGFTSAKAAADFRDMCASWIKRREMEAAE